MKAQTLTILGMNRLGVSIGLAVKNSPLSMTIVGYDDHHGNAQQAEKLGAIDQARRNMVKAAAAADILVLAQPVSELEKALAAIGADVQEHTVVIDLANLKTAGINWAAKHLQNGHYVGAKLMLAAGKLYDGRTGHEGAAADLFANSIFCVMPSAKVDPAAVDTTVKFGALLGAKPYFVDPVEYDMLVQGVETVPGLAAAALFGMVHQENSWRDILRFAGLPFAQATLPLTDGRALSQMALADKEATMRWLNAFISELEEVRRLVFDGDEEILTAMLEQIDIERERWLRERAKNEWLEVETPDVALPGLAQQAFGSLAAPRRPRKGDD
ncbi:MAG: prephenate dehydrogenase [Anaerolineae bacterium]